MEVESPAVYTLLFFFFLRLDGDRPAKAAGDAGFCGYSSVIGEDSSAAGEGGLCVALSLSASLLSLELLLDSDGSDKLDRHPAGITQASRSKGRTGKDWSAAGDAGFCGYSSVVGEDSSAAGEGGLCSDHMCC